MTGSTIHIALLPGDGIGPDVSDAARRVLDAAMPGSLRFTEHLFGGAALDAEGVPLPPDTLRACLEADAVLMGAAGGPKWDGMPPGKRPENGILNLREGLGVFANVRPASTAMTGRPGPLGEFDLVVVRELTGGIYYGEPRGRTGPDRISGQSGHSEQPEQAFNTMRYSRPEIERIAVIAMNEAERRSGRRSGRVTSVDKANVLEVSRLWRDVVLNVHSDYPDVELNHMYVDNAAMQMVRDPSQFDVILTGNMFGDILSDMAAALVGSLGVLPSASVGGRTPIFEPVHGSAPDIAGSGRSNPVGCILSGAMLLDEVGHDNTAESIRRAVRQTLADGIATPDLGGTASTNEMTEAVIKRIKP